MALAVTAILAVSLLAARAGQQNQQTQQGPKISSEVKMVNVDATVRDKHGKIVPTLTKDDFALDEDGRPQTITYFARESDLPLTLGLLVDTSRSQTRLLDQERQASYVFLDDMIRADKDQAFVLHFDFDVELLQDFTSSRPKLLAALQQIESPAASTQTTSGGTGDDRHGSGHGHGGGGTLLYDAIYLASNELMKKQQGRKALIILTDGDDRGSKESMGSAIESAQRANTAVYSILFADTEDRGHDSHYGGHGMGGRHGGGGSNWPPQRSPDQDRGNGKKVLERISRETGGRMLQVSKKLTIDQIYAEIEEELRNQYVFGYTPDRANPGAGYHKIHLATKQKELTVQARDGYYSEQ
jgi:VWFA-related protein